ncbi:morA [Asticcacaulis biprosthecium C19]|uniref:MorA n=1 Tax=Asticcacaulis biprosthecium C19 TaxID=715226 RepID=F4QHR6_9CAUL|nr:EAL domain-containing protein [Asticcacaulis biprosthecium]EGF92803.1 morA [Asticcacaulis biprosthecium C19]
MFRTLFCLRDQHDYGLVLLAVVICLTSSFAAIHLLHWSQRAEASQRIKWLSLAGVATGFGIWATHFIAMLAYNPGIPLGFNISLTLISLIIAIAITGSGLALAVYQPFRHAAWAGGAIAGSGIGAMHFIGMAAIEVPAQILWAVDLVAASVVLGAGLAAAAVAVAARGNTRLHIAGATGLLVLAIASLHFTAMGAVTIQPDPTRITSGVQLSPTHMSTLIAVSAFSVLLGSLLAALFGQKLDKVRARNENRYRLMVESVKDYAICMLDVDGNVTDWNRAAQDIKGYKAEEILGRNFSIFYTPQEQKDGEPRHILDLALHSGSYHEPEGQRVRKDGTTLWVDLVITPMFDEDGRHIGFSKVTRDITSRKRDEARITYMARHDALTGLPNRTHFLDLLDKDLAVANARGEQVAVIGIDLDGFKEINDQNGNATGDEVLRILGTRLKSIVYGQEAIARVGGDEFVAVMRHDDARDLEAFLERVSVALNEPMLIDNFEVKPGASLGVAIFPQDGDSRDVLLNNADLAMYRAKSGLAEKICYYESSMDEAARVRRNTARDLWTAVENDELRLLYQVQRSLGDNSIVGYEALVRWQHPTRGLVPPVEFISIAEECGAIIEIGKWVLAQACEDAAKWNGDIKIAVNLSPAQLTDPDLVAFVRQALYRTGLSPRRLELEITESMVIADRTRALHILRQLKALGVTIAIDDFGTGYSSLDTLNAFRFDKIKIDRSFLKDSETNPQARTIIRAIVALGRSLEIKVLAEGVETKNQLDLLKLEGCEEAQGYLFGRPEAVEAAEARLLAQG